MYYSEGGLKKINHRFYELRIVKMKGFNTEHKKNNAIINFSHYFVFCKF